MLTANKSSRVRLVLECRVTLETRTTHDAGEALREKIERTLTWRGTDKREFRPTITNGRRQAYQQLGGAVVETTVLSAEVFQLDRG